ncbi:MAG: acetylglutamate kinase [Candidatus Limnocylindrales bacterium]
MSTRASHGRAESRAPERRSDFGRAKPDGGLGARAAQPHPDQPHPELVVVKLGGTTIAAQEHVLDQVAELARSRPVIVVHGGGARVTDWLGRLGVPTRFEDGLRVTDAAALEVAAAVLRGALNVELVAALRARGCDAVGVSGVDGGLLAGRRVHARGLVVTIQGVRAGLLETLLVAGHVPVLAPLALDESGVVCNVNADDAAAGLAFGLGAGRLVLLTDVDGIRGADGARIPSLGAEQAERLIADGTIAGGMIPKVRAALRGLAPMPGAEAVIADGSRPDVLRRALDGSDLGTRIVAA